MFIVSYCSRGRIHNGGASEHSLGMEADKDLRLFKNKELFLKCVFVLLPGVECRNEFSSDYPLLAVVVN